MAAPIVQDPQTPWAGYTFGRLIELSLRKVGLSNPAHAAPDVSRPPATAEEIAMMADLTREALVHHQQVRDRYWPLTETTLTAEVDGSGEYPTILLPADYGRIVRHGCHVDGYPVDIITTQQYLETRLPDEGGGGTALASPGSGRVRILRVATQKQNAATDVWRQMVFGYPKQSAPWTLELFYFATAKNLSGDTDAVRVPLLLQPSILRYVDFRWSEETRDLDGAARRMALFNSALNEIENIPPSEEQDLVLTQGFPVT